MTQGASDDWFSLNTPGEGPAFEGTGEFHPVFSNFGYSLILLDGTYYPTVEHAFQALKTTDLEWRARISRASTPGEAKVLGRRAPLRPDWDEARYDVMVRCLRAKFADPYFGRILSQFRGPIVEWNSWHDRVWGVCTCRACGRTGQNLLGRALEQVRAELLEAGS